MKKTRSVLPLLGLLCALLPALALAVGPAQATVGGTRFIYYPINLTAGTTYTFETRNMTGTSPDTVMYLLSNLSGAWQQYAANDDCPTGGLTSCVTFTPSTTGYYWIWVHGYANGSAGRADVYQNGAVLLTQQDFGGYRFETSWTAGETFRVPGTMNKAGLDTMVFLLRGTAQYIQHDDDSGPNFYPFATASTTETAGGQRVMAGLYPGNTGNHRILQDVALVAGTDNDGDGISNGLEGLLGGNANNNDSDADTVLDTLELFGNDGFSFSEWSRYTARDGFVEIDYMVNGANPSQTRQPYATLATDSASIFNTDGNINLNVFVDQAVAWHEVVCLGACGAGVVDGVNFYDVKTASFSSGNPERRPYFHYTVWGYKHSSNSNCSSGLAEIWGNDLIVSLGCFANTNGQQLGTFNHELGHNLNLTHWGNGNNNGNNSTIHESVMNYRYQLGGIPGGRFTYSVGPNNQCDACGTSPKQACIDCRNAGQCGVGSCVTCDCDLNEWTGAINMDFRKSGASNNGSALLARYAGTASSSQDEKVRPSRRVVPELPISRADRAAEVAQRVALLEEQGELRGKDFLVSDDGQHVYAVCE